MTKDERAAEETLQYQLLLIDSITRHAGVGRHDLVVAGSELATDDSLLGGHPTSHLVGHCLSVSIDALQTVHLILTDSSTGGLRVPVMGQYPVLRTSIESASLAVWLLAPDVREERVWRSLSARIDEIHHDDHLVTVLTEAEPTDTKSELAAKQKQRRENSAESRKQKRRIREYAASAGVPMEGINPGLPGFGPIVRDSGETMGRSGIHTQGIWCYISGLTHPSVKRSVAASDIERLAAGDGLAARFTANLPSVVMAVDAAISAHIAALKLLARRGSIAEIEWFPGPGFPLPPGYAAQAEDGSSAEPRVPSATTRPERSSAPAW
ncbi:hypothetical protein ACPPVW_18350 [Leifsonia sp. McL0607]|uniref:hypothetical protein n=1 Tax=Leifsonia sp. McL0607 TaxID=3415672 RepID=UPI003CEC7FFC